jgi:hypothetical protein
MRLADYLVGLLGFRVSHKVMACAVADLRSLLPGQLPGLGG